MTRFSPSEAAANVIASEWPEPGAPATSARGRRASLRDERGAVFVEFLIAFLPVFTFFLCLLQLGLLFAVRLVVEHAATNAARAAAVIIGDDPRRYGGSQPKPNHVLDPRNGGKRLDEIRKAALLTLAPFILDGTIHKVVVELPPPNEPEGEQARNAITYAAMNMTAVSKVRVRLKVTANCKIGFAAAIACSNPLFGGDVIGAVRGYRTRVMRAEAMYPYQGASYDYP